MKYIFLLISSVILLSCNSPYVKNYEQTSEGVLITILDATLGIYPLTDNVVRIKYLKDSLEPLPELIFSAKTKTPEFSVSENETAIEVHTKSIQVIIDKHSGNLSFADSTGNVFLSEKAGSRKLVADTIQNELCYLTEQQFNTSADEYIFGLGQFQDGHYNLRGISRRLTQVNSQIAIPFIYSSKGYGLLWHQYGLTDFNPADNFVELTKNEQTADDSEAIEVTTTSGTQKVSQHQSLYTGTIEIPSDGKYSVFLDLGSMGNRHFLAIDSVPCLDQSNMWLPPTAGTLVSLKKGTHPIQIICKSDNTPSLSWKLVDDATTFRSPHTKMLDYVVFYGPSADNVISSYRNLTGNAPMLPKWAYGFWQCRERYTSGNHLVETVKEFRKRKLPVDVIVQDWQYWGENGWGVPMFDKTNYPDPSGFIGKLHDLNAHFTISIWSNPDKNSEIGKEYVEKGRFIPGTKWLDYFNPATRQEYWNTLKTNMFDYGVDAWWMDAVEPENDALKGTRTYAGIGDFFRLTYPLMVSKAVYEGQRDATSDKRVCILTRSAFSGQQRYGVINWSGDIGGTWDAYKRQIVAGLNFTITGLPYWTTDIGGFFRPGSTQYSDKKFHELLIRWHQWGAFNPIFRVHGYMTETEPWKYGKEVEDNMRKMQDLRYRLMPYIYSEAWQVTKNGSTMMRPLVMDFSEEDTNALLHPYEYMFGPSFLVAPVTEPDVNMWSVYLPKSAGWYNFWTNEYCKGGQVSYTEAPLDKIPLFVRAGSIIPFGKEIQYTSPIPADTLEIHIYPGADAQFELYEDEGDGYNYEKDINSVIPFSWSEKDNQLTIHNRKGNFPGMPDNRIFKIVMVKKHKSHDTHVPNKEFKYVQYSGKKIVMHL